uniref:Uncharacterized protein n=1 Tax=Cucumis melo TaxID=3656 RepID=A0A9I9DZ06_CUCME
MSEEALEKAVVKRTFSRHHEVSSTVWRFGYVAQTTSDEGATSMMLNEET